MHLLIPAVPPHIFIQPSPFPSHPRKRTLYIHLTPAYNLLALSLLFALASSVHLPISFPAKMKIPSDSAKIFPSLSSKLPFENNFLPSFLTILPLHTTI